MLALLKGPAFRPAHTFLSPDSVLGFAVLDYAELIGTLLLILLVVLWAWARRRSGGWKDRPLATFLVLAMLPVAMRLVLLPRCPVPIPSGADDFSYILLADTLRHFRLAMPAHAFPRFFEQVFVLQEPTYSSMYALGQGLALALGWLLFGHPWAGVLLSTAVFCGTCYWMLRGWMPSDWALAGGVLAVVQFGPLSYWTNSYWGGAVAASAGCLVFGALPRLRQSGRVRDAVLLGLGLAIHWMTRPFECCFLLISAAFFFVPDLRRGFAPKRVLRLAGVAGLLVLGALALTGLHNKQVTGSWTTLPYMLSQYQYGTPPTFTLQPNPVPHRVLNEEQELTYRAEAAIHRSDRETVRSYAERLFFRLRFVRFFVLPPLYLAVLAFCVRLREARFPWVLATIGIFALGSNFFPYFYPHYVAALASLAILMQTLGLQQLNRMQLCGRPLPMPVGSLILLLSVVHFLFFFGAHAMGGPEVLSAVAPLESWDFINYGDPQGRIAVEQQLSKLPGKKLVFVHYAPGHQFQEWVHNDADIDSSPVVRVHDLGPVENEEILKYYPGRTAWLLEPDQSPPRVTPYVRAATGFQDVR